MTRIIDMEKASLYDQATYGIVFKSVRVYQVRGKCVYNPTFLHRIHVWDNTVRPNNDPSQIIGGNKVGEGTYISPAGKGTNKLRSFLVSSQSMIISKSPRPDLPEQGVPLTIGEEYILRYPDGTFSDPLTLTAQPLDDPVLV